MVRGRRRKRHQYHWNAPRTELGGRHRARPRHRDIRRGIRLRDRREIWAARAHPVPLCPHNPGTATRPVAQISLIPLGRPRATHESTTLLMARAPWLPPNTRMTRDPSSGKSHAARARARSGSGAGGGSMGFPVSMYTVPGRCGSRAIDSGYPTYTSRLYRANQRAVRPGALSAICWTTGIRWATAYARAAPDAYPPVPTTSRGCSRRASVPRSRHAPTPPQTVRQFRQNAGR